MFPFLHNRPLTGVFLSVFLTIFLFPRTLSAQFDTASVLGTIRDESGAVLAGATVTLTNQATGISATAQTDENGSYEFLTVKIGTYKIEASLASFSTARLENVRVAVGARQRVDLTMKVGEVTTTIEVSASAALLVETDTSDRGQVINQRQIVELPLNGRNYSDLALLTTGVRRSAYAFANPPREGAFNVNGQRSIFNNFLMDGVDNNAYGTSNQGFSNQVVQATPDAVAEFKVVTSDHERRVWHGASGAVINASIKSGDNEFHGSAWEFLRNTSLNADRLLSSLATGKAGFPAQSVWLYLRRPDRQESGVLLHRLGRLSRAAEVCGVLESPTAERASGDLQRGRCATADGRSTSGEYADSAGSQSRRSLAVFWQICRAEHLEVPVARGQQLSKIFAPTRTTTTRSDLEAGRADSTTRITALFASVTARATSSRRQTSQAPRVAVATVSFER